MRQLAQEYGLSEEQTNSLVNAANDYEQKRQAAANAELSAGTGDNIGYIEDAVQSGAITEEQGKAQIENIQESNYNSFAEDISYGYADTDAIDKAYADGKISQAQYDDLKAKWNNAIDTSASTFYIYLKSNKQQHKTNGSYDFRIHNRKIIYLFHHIPDHLFRFT